MALLFLEDLGKEYKDVIKDSEKYLSPSKLPYVDQDQITIKYHCYDLSDYPNGDNREFSITGAHKFEKLKFKVEDRYFYKNPLLIFYKSVNNENITIDCDEVY